VTVHVRVVTPAPTYVHWTLLVSGDPTVANASQSCAPPAPFASVTVTCPPAGTLVALTASVAACCTVTVGLVAARV